METTEKQQGKQHHLAPWQYKKGQSGNPKGRPKGKTLKEYVREKFETMNEEEKEIFLEGIDKRDLWEMGEGKAQQSGKLEVDIPKSLFELLQHAKTTSDSTGSESVQG